MAYDESTIGVDREKVVIVRNIADQRRDDPGSDGHEGDQDNLSRRHEEHGDPATALDNESSAIDFPSRDECIKELEAWEALKTEADRIVNEFARQVEYKRVSARAYRQDPPVRFTYDIPRGKGLDYITKGLGTLIARRLQRAGWSVETSRLPNADLRITIS